jgi:hypothetical protein
LGFLESTRESPTTIPQQTASAAASNPSLIRRFISSTTSWTASSSLQERQKRIGHPTLTRQDSRARWTQTSVKPAPSAFWTGRHYCDT